jgi:hypothetical protein
MMQELQQELPTEYPSLVQYVATNGKGTDRLRIDIDEWVNALPDDRYDVALDIISNYSKTLKKQASQQYYFTVPQALE